MTTSNESSIYTDVTWSAKTLNLSISRFFLAIKAGLGVLHHNPTNLSPSSPVLTWDHFRDQLNLVGSNGNSAQEHKTQYSLLKEVIRAIPEIPSFISTTELGPSGEVNRHCKNVSDNDKLSNVHGFPNEENNGSFAELSPLSHCLVENFRGAFYRVPPAFHIDLPNEDPRVIDRSSKVITIPIQKLKNIPLWEQYQQRVPAVEAEFFSVYKTLERRVLEFQGHYNYARINFGSICEFVRTKQLNTRAFIKNCRLLSDHTENLQLRLRQFHVRAYDNFMHNNSYQGTNSTISVAHANYGILMELLFDLRQASVLCEDRLSRCKESLSRVKSALITGEEAFHAFQLVHGKYVRNDTLLEKYFWKLWWHFDIIQQELYGKGVKESYEKHLQVLVQSTSESYEGCLLLAAVEPKLRSLHLLISQIERMHESRMITQGVIRRLDNLN